MFGPLHTGVLVGHLGHGGGAVGVLLDHQAVRIGGDVADQVRSVDVVVQEQHIRDRVFGYAPDGEPVGSVEPVVRDGNVRCGRVVGLDRHAIVTRLDGGVDDGRVGQA